MATSNPVNLAPVLAVTEANITAELNQNQADIAANQIALIAQINENQTDIEASQAAVINQVNENQADIAALVADVANLNAAVAGKAGSFKTTYLSGRDGIPATRTGVLFSIVPPLGQRVKLDSLISTGSATESDVELRVGGEVVAAGFGLDDDSGNSSEGFFTIQRGANGGTHAPILGGVDEAIELVKLSGYTDGAVWFSYQFGI